MSSYRYKDSQYEHKTAHDRLIIIKIFTPLKTGFIVRRALGCGNSGIIYSSILQKPRWTLVISMCTWLCPDQCNMDYKFSCQKSTHVPEIDLFTGTQTMQPVVWPFSHFGLYLRSMRAFISCFNLIRDGDELSKKNMLMENLSTKRECCDNVIFCIFIVFDIIGSRWSFSKFYITHGIWICHQRKLMHMSLLVNIQVVKQVSFVG